MSGQTGSKEDRTEAPTPRRLERAREEGEIPVSHEVVLLAGLVAPALVLMMIGPAIGRRFVRALAQILAQPDMSLHEPVAVFHEIAVAFAGVVAAFAVPIALGAIAVTLAQTRFVLRSKGLHPDLGRISPARGLKRLFAVDTLVETAKSLIKLLIVGFTVFQATRQELPRIESLPAAPLTMLPDILASIVTRLLIAAVLAQAVIAGADLLWMWRQHLVKLRMTRSDVKDEAKETEGDPAVKMRIRRLRMRRARQRMLAAVPTATVVITNPTHYAAALTYDATKSTVSSSRFGISVDFQHFR
jgi:flagellar biosynthesis protein FlhB